LIISKNNYTFTDNTNELAQNIVFVSSKQNEQYLNSIDTSVTQIQDSELIKYFDFSKINIIGITGTNGKTTTAAAMYSLFLDLGYKVAFQGTRGLYINEHKVKEYSLTTPVQLEIFSNIEESINQECTYFIMEVSSHAIAQNRICGLDFALKIHTNITRDHLDYHNTLQEYINVKNSFFNDDSVKLINKDDKNIKYKLKNAFAYGLDNPSTYKVQAFTFKNGTSVALQYFGEMYSFITELRGTFNVYNLTCALSAVHILTKKPLQDICDLIDNFAGVSGRMETISNKPQIIVDFAHTPDGMKSIFESFKDKKIICVFGAGGDRDKDKRIIMGKIANEYCDKIILTSDNPRFEDPDHIMQDIAQGVYDKKRLHLEINRKEAIKTAIHELDDSYVLLILGKGDEQFQTIYDKKFPFNDKKVVQSILANNLKKLSH
jgi:UDP-N-acetylmuramoyl-L-alanyl-D-glutamate--2,6-diaminopimelate ligase